MNDDVPAWLPFAIPIAFLVVFPLFWMGIVGLLATVSGWSGLAERYAQRTSFMGATRSGVAARIRGVNYNGTLTLGGNAQGLHLSMIKLFSYRHAPLFIPWQDIRASRKKFWFVEIVELELGRDAIPVQLRMKFAEPLVAASQGAFALPELQR